MTIQPTRQAAPTRAGAAVQPFTFVLFGASGDLARRMVVPALFRLWRRGLLGEDFQLIGYGRTAMTDTSFRRSLEEGSVKGEDAEAWPAFAAKLSYQRGQYEGDDKGYQALVEHLGAEDPTGARSRRLFYLALPPQEFAPVLASLARMKLLGRRYQAPEGGWARVVVEKPFGRDLTSARALEAAIARDLDESAVYRIDHYLGKEAAQNLFTFRFGNGLFEPVWNRNHIDHVQITAAETLGVEGRGGYYEGAGALRDMVQNHLLQLMALVAIEPPQRWNAAAVRDEKVKVLQAIRRYDRGELDRAIIRGQYGPGELDGKPVPGYREEPGVDPRSTTETFVALRLEIENWRWAGVPFYLRSGKRLAARKTEIAVQFKPAPHTPFPVPETSGGANSLVVQFAPAERLTLRLAGKRAGQGMHVAPVDLSCCPESDGPAPSAYENLLHDALLGDATFFARGDEVDASWQLIDPILAHWAEGEAPDLVTYPAGSASLVAADALLAAEGRLWRDIRGR